MSNVPKVKTVSFKSGETFRSAFPQRFKPKAGEAYRLFLPEVDSAYQIRVHYLKPNYVFCLAANEINQECPACMTGDRDYRATWRYGMNVVVYKTDIQGNLRPIKKEVNGQQVDAFDWDVQLWLFAQTPANAIHSLRNTWDLQTHDIKLTCISERPQKYDIQPCQDSVFTARPDLQALITTAIKNERRDPLKEMGIEQTADEIAQAIAAGVGKGQNGPAFGKPGQPQTGYQQPQIQAAPYAQPQAPLAQPPAQAPVQPVQPVQQVAPPVTGAVAPAQPQAPLAQPQAPVQQVAPQNYPQQPLQQASYSSPSVIAPTQGNNPGDVALAKELVKPVTGVETRDVSGDKEFNSFLDDIRTQS